MGIEVLLPHSQNGLVGRFLKTWVPDEQRHGVAQEVLLEHLGLTSYVARGQDVVPIHNRIAGTLTRLLPAARGIVEMAYHAIGAINERFAMEAYREMADIMTELGEHEVVDTLMTPMRNDEAMHLAYYRTYARQLRNSSGEPIGSRCCTPIRWFGVSMNPPVPGADACRIRQRRHP